MFLRNRKIPDVPQEIKKKSKLRDDGFPGLYECWAQSKTHKQHFLNHLNCAEIQKYHNQINGCKPFDKLIARWAEEKYKENFFGYYKLKGKKPRVLDYTTGLVKDKTILRKLSELALIKRYPDELEHIPEPYDHWPIHLYSKIRLDAIECCIKRRLLFRNACVRACCKRIDTNSHDNFLLILQILRARIIMYRH
jgi:hypothetical protein